MGTRSVRIEAKAHAGRDNKQAWPIIRIGALLALVLASGQAVLADTPVLPAGAPTPGQVQSTLPIAPLAPAPKAAPLTSTPQPTTATIAPGGPTVTVQRFVITGNTVFGTDALQAEIAPYLGQ